MSSTAHRLPPGLAGAESAEPEWETPCSPFAPAAQCAPSLPEAASLPEPAAHTAAAPPPSPHHPPLFVGSPTKQGEEPPESRPGSAAASGGEGCGGDGDAVASSRPGSDLGMAGSYRHRWAAASRSCTEFCVLLAQPPAMRFALLAGLPSPTPSQLSHWEFKLGAAVHAAAGAPPPTTASAGTSASTSGSARSSRWAGARCARCAHVPY